MLGRHSTTTCPQGPEPMPRIDELKEQLAQLDALAAQGVLSEAAHADARAKLERALIEAVLAGEAPTTAPSALAAGGGATKSRSRYRLGGALVALVIAVSVAGYAWTGNLDAARPAPAEAAASRDADQAPHGANSEQVEAMVARLVERLKDKPDDADGWTMLGRTYATLGRHAQALEALRKVVALRPNDAQALADLADGIAVTNQRSLEGEPERLIAQALKLDPKNVKALALAGTVAFGHDDFKTAAELWQRAVANAEPNADFTRQLQSALAEARERAGLPILALPTVEAKAVASASASASAATAGAGRVSGRVSLASTWKDRVAPGDTVFVFARAASGPRMPLAIMRRQASELPFEFTLDDSMAMSPATRLSTSKSVIEGARISKSGNAMPQAGDLQGLSAPVRLGSTGLQIVIGEAVR
jgi:cytochrome c-type biogenesis protein CcmH